MNIVITGANRGIGLGLAKKYLSAGHTVWATCRNPHGSRELWELERDYGPSCQIVELDVSDTSTIAALKSKLSGIPVDLLINNAGVFPEGSKDLGGLDLENMMKAFKVNAIGPSLVCQALKENLEKAELAKVMNITSKMGSIADNTSGAYYAYRMSKAALNMFNKSFSIDCPKIMSVVVHPGWVQTDMGGHSAPTTVEESVDGIYNLSLKISKAHSGKFYDFQSKEIPW
jgi:NAD(P)-dependent dehydrogenase (short-subunit alcohol dehydrogenase family)